MSNSDSDYASDHSDVKGYCRCIVKHDAYNVDELEFDIGDIIRVIDDGDEDWWWGECNDKEGWFSTSFVEVVQLRSAIEYFAEVARTKSGTTKKMLSEPFRRKRAKVMEEFVTSETEYVDNLDHVIRGYMMQCDAFGALFPDDLKHVIFANVEDIYDLHVRFLRRIKRAVRQNCVGAIGRLFLTHQKTFEVYQEYCTNFDKASETISGLLAKEEYNTFFNNCRTMDQSTVRLPLSSYLLCPVQRICKYPLQLESLLKVVENDDDEATVRKAVDVMTNIPKEINKAKQEMKPSQQQKHTTVEAVHAERAVDVDEVDQECYASTELVRFQSQVSNWSGPDLSMSSSQLIHSSKATLISLTEHISDGGGSSISCSKKPSLFMYLFDNQLVLCSNGYFNTLVYYRRFDLAYLSFTTRQNNFIFSSEHQNETDGYKGPLSPLPAPPNKGRIEVHVKGRQSRQQWRYLLNLEIGFAKIKRQHKEDDKEDDRGGFRIAEDICNFIRTMNNVT